MQKADRFLDGLGFMLQYTNLELHLSQVTARGPSKVELSGRAIYHNFRGGFDSTNQKGVGLSISNRGLEIFSYDPLVPARRMVEGITRLLGHSSGIVDSANKGYVSKIPYQL